MSTLRLRVVTPYKTLVDEEVASVQFTGLDGKYGILPRHAALITVIAAGPLRYRNPAGEAQELLITDGFAEMRDNVLTISADSGEHPLEIDIERARAAEKRARDRLANRAALAETDVIRAEAALRRAMSRQIIGARPGQRRSI